jgi:hypothetical protein
MRPLRRASCASHRPTRHAASGAGETALNRYAALYADDTLGGAARYNSANLLLRQRIELRPCRSRAGARADRAGQGELPPDLAQRAR